MKFLSVDSLLKKNKVSPKALKNILGTVSLPETSINAELICKKNLNSLLIEDITVYEDIINSTSADKKSNLFILKDSDKNSTELICFKSQVEPQRVSIRTLKQKLGDISTSYVTKQFTDDAFAKFFQYFYVPLNIFIESYAKWNNLRVPEDICFKFKGGNIFKMLLQDIMKLLPSYEFYNDLLKRSDADFQVFINPDIDNYEAVFKDISILIVYSLLLFKKTIHTKKIFDFLHVNEDELLQLFKKELVANGVPVVDLKFAKNQNKQDFSVEPMEYANDEVIVFREHKKSLTNSPKITKNNDFFISRNTALNFKRKDHLRASFDLIRMKKNFRIVINLENGTSMKLCVPSEIIDVSLPKNKDTALISLKDKINHYIFKYHFSNSKYSFDFWAPNIDYMIKDLDDILFQQNDYPWSDLKIAKRVARYFISLMFHNIMIGIMNQKDLPIILRNFKKELVNLKSFLKCYVEKNDCDLNHGSLASIIATRYEKLSLRINSIKNKEERVAQIQHFVEFNKQIQPIITMLVSDVGVLLTHIDRINQQKIKNIYDHLVYHRKITLLGGSHPVIP